MSTSLSLISCHRRPASASSGSPTSRKRWKTFVICYLTNSESKSSSSGSTLDHLHAMRHMILWTMSGSTARVSSLGLSSAEARQNLSIYGPPFRSLHSCWTLTDTTNKTAIAELCTISASSSTRPLYRSSDRKPRRNRINSDDSAQRYKKYFAFFNKSLSHQ